MEIQKSNNRWIAALGAVCAAILAWGYFFSSNTEADLAYLVGYHFFIAAILSTLFYMIAGRETPNSAKAVSFAAIYVALIAASYMAANMQQRQAIAAIDLALEDMRRLSGDDTQPIELPRREAVATKGDAAALELFLKDRIEAYARLRNDYLLELQAIGWERFLDPRRLANDLRLAESVTMMSQAKAIVEKYQAKSEAMVGEGRSRIAQLAISEGARRSMLAGYETGVKESAANNTLTWELERQVLREMESLIVMLGMTRKNWAVQDEQILFQRDADLARFNGHLERVNEIVQRQQEIIQGQVDRVSRLAAEGKEGLR